MAATAPGAPQPDDMPAVELVIALYTGRDVDEVLDRIDNRQAACGLAWLFAQMIGLSGTDPATFMDGLKAEVISAHLRRPVE